MKITVLALAVLGAFAGEASAQSNVTIYGQVDAALGKSIGASYQQTRDKNSDLFTIGGKYKFGAFGINAGYSKGSGVSSEDIKSFLIAGTWQLGAGEARIGYAEERDSFDSNAKFKKIGLGYHYQLSKRTKVYVDFARGNEALAGGDSEKNGYDFGVQHKF